MLLMAGTWRKRSSAFLFPPSPAGHGEQFSLPMVPFHGTLLLTDVIIQWTSHLQDARCSTAHKERIEEKRKYLRISAGLSWADHRPKQSPNSPSSYYLGTCMMQATLEFRRVQKPALKDARSQRKRAESRWGLDFESIIDPPPGGRTISRSASSPIPRRISFF